MANDDDWVADVRRWVRAAGQVKQAPLAQPVETEPAPLGYEAAHPQPLWHQGRDAMPSGFSEPA